jgi:hypothetical protein
VITRSRNFLLILQVYNLQKQARKKYSLRGFRYHFRTKLIR